MSVRCAGDSSRALRLRRGDLVEPFEAFNRYEAEVGLPLDTIRRINATNPDDNAWAHFERGEYSAARFVEAFEGEARAIGFEVDGSRVIASLRGVIRPAMVEALAGVRRTSRPRC